MGKGQAGDKMLSILLMHNHRKYEYLDLNRERVITPSAVNHDAQNNGNK